MASYGILVCIWHSCSVLVLRLVTCVDLLNEGNGECGLQLTTALEVFQSVINAIHQQVHLNSQK